MNSIKFHPWSNCLPGHLCIKFHSLMRWFPTFVMSSGWAFSYKQGCPMNPETYMILSNFNFVFKLLHINGNHGLGGWGKWILLTLCASNVENYIQWAQHYSSLWLCKTLRVISVVYLQSTLYLWTSLSEKRRMLGLKSLPVLRRWRKSMPTGAQYMTLHSKSGWRKVNICQFGPGKWFFSCIVAQFDEPGKGKQSSAPLQKSSKYDLTSVLDRPIIMIGPGGLLLVVPSSLQFCFSLTRGIFKNE